MKLKELFIKTKNIIDKYELSLISSSTAFYMVVAIFSLFILILQFYNYFNNNNFIINKLIDIINPYYINTLENLIPVFTINKYSPILFLNLIWSSSKFINGFNKASDIIYAVNKKRNYIVNRVSSIFIFIIILSVIFFEIVTIFFANKIINFFIENIVIYMVIQFIIDLFLIFTIIILINKYVPPVKMTIKKVLYGSLLSTFLIYLSLIIFIILVYVINKININFNIITLISLFFLLIYFINYSIVIGIYINYYLQKHPN